MLTMLITSWTRYREADRRQLPLFPEWERALWLAPLPAVGAAVMLLALVAVGTPWTAGDVVEPRVARTEPAVEVEEAPEPAYDLAAIPDHIKAAARRYRLPEELITAVIAVESNFDHAAVSRKGAQGLMQLMPQTAALIGVKDPHAPDENIDAGASHLRAMLDTFNGDLPLALAAYNAGQQHVVRHRGIPPFPETRRFVARVLRRMGDKKGAEHVLARPVPPPQWISRTPRPQPKIQMLSAPPAHAAAAVRPTMIPTAGPRAWERPSQLVLHDLEARPSARAWSATPTPLPTPASSLDEPVVPAPTVPLSQAP